jgi:hypothetical protein
MTRSQLALTAGLALYLAALGFVGGMLVERVRFDQRRARVLTRLTTAEQQLHGRLLELERSIP